MPRLFAADEYFGHQIPEPYPSVAVHHEHWRDSYYYGMHPRGGIGDAIILTMAHYPLRETLDSHEFSFIDGERLFAHFTRPYGDDPHSSVVGPIRVEIVEPFKTLRLTGDGAEAPVGFDITFTARTQPYALRRGTMKRGDEIIWDQSHFLQSGTLSGWYSRNGVTKRVDDWWCQRDHSWGIRDHQRCPMWLWLAIQLPDGMFAIWHWEYPNGARVFTDGCFAPADGSTPIPLIDFRHDLHWIDKDGNPAEYGTDGAAYRRPRGAHRGGARGRTDGGDRRFGAAVRVLRPVRRRPAPAGGAHRRRPHRNGDLRTHRLVPPPLLPDPARGELPAGIAARPRIAETPKAGALARAPRLSNVPALCATA